MLLYFTILVFTAIEDVGRPNRGPVKVKLCLGHNVGRGHLIFNQFTVAIAATFQGEASRMQILVQKL